VFPTQFSRAAALNNVPIFGNTTAHLGKLVFVANNMVHIPEVGLDSYLILLITLTLALTMVESFMLAAIFIRAFGTVGKFCIKFAIAGAPVGSVGKISPARSLS
jgi:hypothetical protein